jgi:hypothetical protein
MSKTYDEPGYAGRWALRHKLGDAQLSFSSTTSAMAASTSAVPVAAFPEKAAAPALPTLLSPLQPLADAYGRYSTWRAALGLPHPGTAEGLQKEVKCVSAPRRHIDRR